VQRDVTLRRAARRPAGVLRHRPSGGCWFPKDGYIHLLFPMGGYTHRTALRPARLADCMHHLGADAAGRLYPAPPGR
jgi:hypothetical protein